jgi:hypothetical protein
MLFLTDRSAFQNEIFRFSVSVWKDRDIGTIDFGCFVSSHIQLILYSLCTAFYIRGRTEYMLIFSRPPKNHIKATYFLILFEGETSGIDWSKRFYVGLDFMS